MPSKVPATMACAKPIVVSAAGETAAVVSKSGSGWTCAPGDVNQLEVALRQAVALGKHALEAMGIAAQKAYETEFAAEIGVGRIERLLAGARA
jgi:glycosyltransferase involved in cell wall biosynthesis